MTSQAGVKKSLDAARTSDVVEKVLAHRSTKKASAFSCPTRDRIDAVDHFISPKVGPKSLLWDFFNNVTRACRVETRLDTFKFRNILKDKRRESLDAARTSACATPECNDYSFTGPKQRKQAVTFLVPRRTKP